MLKLLTHFRLWSNRYRNLQNPNPNLNIDDSQQQQNEEENNTADDDDVNGSSERMRDNDEVSWESYLPTASSSEIWGNVDDDDDDDVRRSGELQSASSSERRTDGEDVSGDAELYTASTSDGRTNDYVDDDVGRGTHVKASGEEVEKEAASFSVRREVEKASALTCAEEKKRMEAPPSDDCCPICFGNFSVPCRGPCGHWYCGGCILQYWNYTAALQPCNCPMCSRKITKLTPEGSLYQRQETEVVEVLRNLRKYNRLFVGGTYGLILKVFELPLYMKRLFSDMMNPDRPGAHLNKLRIFAMFLGVLYSISPFDFLRIGRRNVVDIFDYSAIVLSLILYGYGIYLRRRRFRHVRELAEIQL